VIAERSRGILLYSLAGLVLAGGGAWFLASDPVAGESDEVGAWRETAERVLPDTPLQATAETLALTSGGRVERTAPVDGGSYTLSMVCVAGTGQVRVRVSSSGSDSGRAVPCEAESPTVDRIVGLALTDQFYLRLSAENDSGGAVFRWRLERSRGF
jgi:hypothetical protein